MLDNQQGKDNNQQSKKDNNEMNFHKHKCTTLSFPHKKIIMNVLQVITVNLLLKDRLHDKSANPTMKITE